MFVEFWIEKRLNSFIMKDDNSWQIAFKKIK